MSRFFEKTAVLFAVAISAAGIGHAQSLEQMMNDAAAKVEGANDTLSARSLVIEHRLQEFSNMLSMPRCDCSQIKEGCSAEVSLTPVEGGADYRITTGTKQCVRVSSFIGTQWDIDNKTPIDEHVSVFFGGQEEQSIFSSDLNGRQPILISGSTCNLCEDHVVRWCNETQSFLADYDGSEATVRSAANAMDQPIDQMKAGGMPARMVNATIKQKEILDRQATLLEGAIPSIKSRRAELCE